MKVAIILIGLCACLVSCHTINRWCGLEDDNFVEEALEDVLEHETGIDVDFTPSSPEE